MKSDTLQCAIAYMVMTILLPFLHAIIASIGLPPGENVWAQGLDNPVWITTSLALVQCIFWLKLISKAKWAWSALITTNTALAVGILSAIVVSSGLENLGKGLLVALITGGLPLWVLLSDKPTNWKTEESA